MKALGWWLMLLGSLRLASVWFGFFDIWALRLAVFSSTTMSEVHGRTFGVWTLLTCTLCFLCAFNLDNKPLYMATFLSFIYALGHFLTEYLIYQTMTIANLSTVGFFAGMRSFLAPFVGQWLWMGLGLEATCFADQTKSFWIDYSLLAITWPSEDTKVWAFDT